VRITKAILVEAEQIGRGEVPKGNVDRYSDDRLLRRPRLGFDAAAWD